MPDETTRPAFACDYQRMWDLVRAMRSELLDAGLITREEYAELLSAETRNTPGRGSPAARRLESYDELRAKLAARDAEIARLRTRTVMAEHRSALERMGRSSINEAIEDRLRIELAEAQVALEQREAELSRLRAAADNARKLLVDLAESGVGDDLTGDEGVSVTELCRQTAADLYAVVWTAASGT